MRQSISVLLLAVFLTDASRAADDRSAQDDADLTATIANLDAPEFAARQAAQEQLKELTAEQLGQLAEQVRTTPSAEAAVRCVRVLEHHFLKADSSVATAAWEALNDLHDCDRACVREEVAWVLSHRWKKQSQLALDQLRQHGALIVTPESSAAALAHHRSQRAGTPIQRPGALMIRPAAAVPVVQIFLTDEWNGDQTALNILKQLPGLQMKNAQAFGGNAGAARRLLLGRNRNGQPLVSIFLVAGHSLNEKEEAWVQGAFGNTVQERGGVMLGIKASGAVTGAGCGVQEVVPFGSGDAAGLRGGDLITSVGGRKIASFEDLVDELRRFNGGDMIDVTIRRFGAIATAPDRKEPTLSVTLRSWKDYVKATNQAAAEYETTVQNLRQETADESTED